MLLLRPVKKQVLTALQALPARSAAKLISGGEVQAAGDVAGRRKLEPADEILDLSEQQNNPSMKKLSTLKTQLVDKVKAEPAGASQLVQNWLREGGVE